LWKIVNVEIDGPPYLRLDIVWVLLRRTECRVT